MEKTNKQPEKKKETAEEKSARKLKLLKGRLEKATTFDNPYQIKDLCNGNRMMENYVTSVLRNRVNCLKEAEGKEPKLLKNNWFNRTFRNKTMEKRKLAFKKFHFQDTTVKESYLVTLMEKESRPMPKDGDYRRNHGRWGETEKGQTLYDRAGDLADLFNYNINETLKYKKEENLKGKTPAKIEKSALKRLENYNTQMIKKKTPKKEKTR